MKEKLDSYTWTKQMIAREPNPRKLRKLFIKRYGTRNVPFLKSVLNQFKVVPGEDGIWWQ